MLVEGERGRGGGGGKEERRTIGVLGELGERWVLARRTGLAARLVAALEEELSSLSSPSLKKLILVGVAGRSGSSNSGL